MDILEDVRARCVEYGLDAHTVARAIDAVRRDWAGERPYIPKLGERAGEWLSRRNAAIVRDWRHGEHIAFLARKYGISISHVYRIIKFSHALSGHENAEAG